MSGGEGHEPGVPFIVPNDAEPVPVPEPAEPVMPHVGEDAAPVEPEPKPAPVVEPEPKPDTGKHGKG